MEIPIRQDKLCLSPRIQKLVMNKKIISIHAISERDHCPDPEFIPLI